MSDPSSRLPARPSFEQLQKRAKDLLRDVREGDPDALERFRNTNPKSAAKPAYTLADAQFVIARESGFATWAALKKEIGVEPPPRADRYEQLAEALVAAYGGSEEALQTLHEVYGGAFTRSSTPFNAEALRAHVHQRLTPIVEMPEATAHLSLEHARLFLARLQGFETWDKLLDDVSVGTKTAPRKAKPVCYRIDWKEHAIEIGPIVSPKDWDEIAAAIEQHRIPRIEANGTVTDAALRRLSKLECVTALNLDGCLKLTDAGLAHLARMPQLRKLDLSGWKGSLTDQGLAVLAQLTELRHLEVCWQQHVSDAGLTHLSACTKLERVNVMGTPAGDGTLRALGGITGLKHLQTGRGVTDAGFAALHDVPRFKAWHGGEIEYSLMSSNAAPTFLLLDGPFTNAGLQQLRGLDGLFGLSFFWHCPEFTSEGLAVLRTLPRLGFLGCQDAHCDDEAMRQMAAIPELRMLMGQGAVATDAGYRALSRSQTLEYMWGRECTGLRNDGFAALSAMPALRGFALSLAQVDDAALSTLPRFPALRELVPMDVTDDSFRHIGACEHLEHLWCMYCRETGDAATEHLSDLKKLKSYYAGHTRITDRSLELLSRIDSLEKLEFWHCLSLTNAGAAKLAALPNLRELTIDGSPGVTRDVVDLFPAHVRVKYSA